MADEEVQAIEKFVLANNKEEALKCFSSTSDFKLYIEGNHFLSLNQDAKVDEILKILSRNPELAKKLEVRKLIKSLEKNDWKAADALNKKFFNFNFEYPAPRSIETQDIEEYSNTLKLEFSNVESASNSEKQFGLLSTEGKYQVVVSKTDDIVFKKILSTGELWKFANVPERFLQYYQSGKVFTETECFKSMSLTQLKKISEICEKVWTIDTFVKALLKKEFFTRMEGLKDDEKYELMKVVAVEVKANTKYGDSIKTIVLLNLLILEIKLGKCEENWFVDYLLFHREHSLYLNEKKGYSNKIKTFQELIIESITEEKILEYYLTRLISRNNSLKPFSDFVVEDFLLRIQYEVFLLRGEPIENIDKKYLKTNLLTSIELEPCEDNPKEFIRNEPVKFSMYVKNISRLLVKVLELNPKNYYLTNNKQITTDIKLDGLISTTEYFYEYSELPQVRVRRDFEFPELASKSGMFVIEMFGNGRHSRIIIKKGSLRYISRLTASGHVVFVLNEDNEVCKSNTGVYLDNRFYEASIEDGRINLPFARSTSTKNIILTDGIISEIVENFAHAEENYELRTGFLINKEQLTSSKTTVFIKPKLYTNGIKAPDSLLTECQAIVNTEDIDSNFSSKTYTDLFIPDGPSSIELEFDLPPRTETLNIYFQGQLEKIDGEKIILVSNYSLQLNQKLHTDEISSLFLRLNNDEYLLEVKGRNGEPIVRETVTVLAHHLYWRESVEQNLSTNENGIVSLGQLKNITNLAARVRGQHLKWDLKSLRGKIEYPSEIKLCEGDEFDIPVDIESDNLENEFWFYSVLNEYVIDTHVSSLNYDPSASVLNLKSLEAGVYYLVFKNSLTSIKIIVLEGIHFDKNFILQENSAVVTNQDYMAIGIQSISIKEETIEVKLSGHSDENTLVYALFFNYLTEDTLQSINELSKLKEKDSFDEIKFIRPSNFYLPSSLLDEEYQYVLDRQKHDRFVGSTLDKPQLLLKRLFLQDTKTETQTAKQGEKLMKESLGASEFYQKSRNLRMASQACLSEAFYSFDFLQHSAIRLQVPVTNNTAIIKKLTNFSNIMIVAYNNIGISYKIQPIPVPVLKKDLRLSSSAIDSIEICKAKALQKEDTLKLENYSTTTLENIDSFSKLFKVLDQIKNFNFNHFNWSPFDLNEWKFLINWPKLSFSKKTEFYDKFVSHELNLFLYNRDKLFFDAVVKPFIQCKMEKDIVDLYLCEDSLESYANFEQVSKLNYLEISLVIDRIKDTQPDQAKSLVRILKDLVIHIETDVETRTKRIDSILRVVGQSTTQKSKADIEILSEDDENLMYEAEQAFHSEISCNDSSIQRRSKAETRGLNKKKRLSKNEDSKIIEARKNTPKTYKKLDETKEFCETFYYKNAKNSRISSKFYAELAESFVNKTPFLSENILEFTESLTQTLLVLSYTSVPFSAEKHELTIEKNSWQIKASSPCIIFYKELTKAEVDLSSSVFLAAKYYETSSSEEKTEVKQFIKEKNYTCQVVFTNISGKDLNLTVLSQIPEGSIPLIPSNYSKTHFVFLGNYTTNSLEFSFYFPSSGNFAHYSANVAVDGKIVGKTERKEIFVSEKYQSTNLESFGDLVISGRKDLILEFLRRENISNISKEFRLGDIYWMMKNKEFWIEVVGIYREKRVYDETLWSFAFLHSDLQALSEIFKINPGFSKELGYFFESKLISTYNEEFKHTEFDPLVNARAYRLGNQERITNNRFKEVYKQFLIYLSEKKTLDDSDYLCLCQYWILQERYNEAKDLYKNINMKPSLEKLVSGPLQLQYDYISCYLDLDLAKKIAPLYKDYPVLTWQKHFKEVLDLLLELESEYVPSAVTQHKEPSLSFIIENESIVLSYENVQSCTIRIYLIDLEVLFSKNPFLIKGTQRFSYVKANFEQNVELAGNSQSIPINSYKGKNILIEVDYKTYTISKSHFSNMLTINVIERFGLIKIMDSERKPRPAVYVKAFVQRKGGSVEFYKDGYTDIRGKFDYVSLNTDSLATIEKFALLIVDDELGSTVQETLPPPQ